MILRSLLMLLAALSTLSYGSRSFGQEQPSTESTKKLGEGESKTDQFLRVRKNPKGRPEALETSITRYEMKTKDGERVTVDLIGVVHIGEKEYYEELNRRFENYQGLLFELVAPEGTVITKEAREGAGLNPIAAMQMGMKSALGLEFQLDHIDYTKSNFIHADMSPAEFAESMKKNQESISGYFLKAMGQSMAMQAAGQGNDSMGMLFAMMSNNKEIKLRRSFAKQIMNMEGGLVMFEGKDGSTIITHRNGKCMDVLQREIENGKRTLAVFYGAGHLPDMEQRLIDDFGMKRAGRSWLTAWSLEMPK
jgi:hypothetical protein